MSNVERKDIVDIKSMSDSELEDFMKDNMISMKVSEARKIVELIGRNPTLTEFHIFNIEWSEHCSYKSSRHILSQLPTDASTVIMGPKEDAGILRLNKEYGIVMAHESHNHPSQVVPFEGAATGVGGIVRDVTCMGAKVIATADPLRFGDCSGNNKDKVKYIAGSVVDGISQYGNAIGVPNIAGDVYFNSSFDDNCLVNVVALGLVKENEIIHSVAPKSGYDVILVGKATDISGFGGAAFASLVLDEDEANKSAVQVPDPFLKNMILKASYAVFNKAREKGVEIGYKDCGAGGVMCASSEMAEAGGYGVEVDINKIHVSMENLPPYVIACSETQERFVFMVPPEFSETVLRIFNEDFDLPNVSKCARASIVGKVRDDKKFVMIYNGDAVCDVDVEVVCSGIKYEREEKEVECKFVEPNLDEPENYNYLLLDVLRLPQIANKSMIYEHYDTEVQGNTIIRSGMADAGVINPVPGKESIALSVDSNPKYNRISPYWGGVNAVAESMRNVAAVGARPVGMTDCLNYGNPEKPEHFWQFKQGVKGLSEAAKGIGLIGGKEPIPFVSGNVSFYNESKKQSVDPSPIVACLGVIDDYNKAITMNFKNSGNLVCLVGSRKDELGGSAYYDVLSEIGVNVPKIDFEQEHGMIYGVVECIDKGLIKSCHDISDGGLVVCVSEMMLGGRGDGKIGCNILLNDDMRADKVLFSESSGFVLELNRDKFKEVEKIFERFNVDVFEIGETCDESRLSVTCGEIEVIKLSNKELNDAWMSGIKEAIE